LKFENEIVGKWDATKLNVPIVFDTAVVVLLKKQIENKY